MPSKILAIANSCTGLGVRNCLLMEYQGKSILVLSTHVLQKHWRGLLAETGADATIIQPRTALKDPYASLLKTADLVILDGDNALRLYREQLVRALKTVTGGLVIFPPAAVLTFTKTCRQQDGFTILPDMLSPERAVQRFSSIRERLYRVPTKEGLRTGPVEPATR